MTSLPNVLAQLSSPSSILPLWNVLKAVPGGGRMMGRLIGRMAPYTGTIKPEVLELEAGYAKMKFRDRKAVRNHLRSVHAIALINLGEATTGVAMMAALPEGMRGIPIHLAMDYVKKARGTITAECTCSVPTSNEKKEYEIHYKQLRHRGKALTLEALVTTEVRRQSKPTSKKSRTAEKQLSLLFAE